MKSVEIVVEATVHPGRDFEAGGHKKPADTADAADEDMTGDEADNIAKFELAHDAKGGAGHHGTECVRSDSSSNDCFGLAFPNDVGDGRRH